VTLTKHTGTRAVASQPFNRGQKWTMITVMNCFGIVAYKIVPGAANGESFREFLSKLVVPAMQAWPGRNSIIVLDGARFHHNAQVRTMVEQAGGHLVFLPPYSPDFNPIELVFGWMKAWLRDHQNVAYQFPDLCMVEALRQIPNDMFSAWINHCGYKFWWDS
jgi:transposase